MTSQKEKVKQFDKKVPPVKKHRRTDNASDVKRKTLTKKSSSRKQAEPKSKPRNKSGSNKTKIKSSITTESESETLYLYKAKLENFEAYMKEKLDDIIASEDIGKEEAKRITTKFHSIISDERSELERVILKYGNRDPNKSPHNESDENHITGEGTSKKELQKKKGNLTKSFLMADNMKHTYNGARPGNLKSGPIRAFTLSEDLEPECIDDLTLIEAGEGTSAANKGRKKGGENKITENNSSPKNGELSSRLVPKHFSVQNNSNRRKLPKKHTETRNYPRSSFDKRNEYAKNLLNMKKNTFFENEKKTKKIDRMNIMHRNCAIEELDEIEENEKLFGTNNKTETKMKNGINMMNVPSWRHEDSKMDINASIKNNQFIKLRERQKALINLLNEEKFRKKCETINEKKKKKPVFK